MCGRFALNTIPKALRDILMEPLSIFLPNYNIAPTQTALVAVNESGIVLREARWGFVPAWTKDTRSVPVINARAETVDSKPMFREAFRKRRCLAPASGFYEWKRNTGGKTPYYFSAASDESPVVFACLWERRENCGDSFAIITTAANDIMRTVHDRMPVILPPSSWLEWLDPDNINYGRLKTFLQPAPENALQCWEVSRYVNSPRNQGERCIEIVEAI